MIRVGSAEDRTLGLDEKFAAQAINRDRARKVLARPQLHKAAGKTSRLFWTWWLTDSRDGSTIATGRALSGKAAWARCHRAYLRELNK